MVVPATAGVNVALWPPFSDAVPGDKVRLTAGGGAEWEEGSKTTASLAVLLGSDTLVATT